MTDIKNPRSKANAGDYEVGRGRPAVHSRFAPGQCGKIDKRPEPVNFPGRESAHVVAYLPMTCARDLK